MRLKLFSLQIILTHLLCSCGQGSDATFLPAESVVQQPIIGGDISGPGEDPETGAVIGNGGICSGTLLAPDVVLTAAHCLENIGLMASRGDAVRKFRHRFTLHPNANQAGIADMVLVRSARVHPGYMAPLIMRDPVDDGERAVLAAAEAACGPKGDSEGSIRAWVQCILQQPNSVRRPLGLYGDLGSQHDLALMFLERPIRTVIPARMPRAAEAAALPSQASLRVVGYGLQNDRGHEQVAIEGQRKRLHAPLVAIGATEMRLSAAPPQACFGDSGGPAFLPGPVPRAVVGVASRLYLEEGLLLVEDVSARLCNTGVIYTRVDPYVDWITDTLQKACVSGERLSCYHPEDASPKKDGCAAAGANAMALLGTSVAGLRRRRVLLGLAVGTGVSLLTACGTPESSCSAELNARASRGHDALVDASPLPAETPHAAVGALVSDLGMCTGTLIERDVVLTAASCWPAESARGRGFVPREPIEFTNQPHLDALRPDDLHAVRWVVSHPGFRKPYPVAESAASGGAYERLRQACGRMPDLSARQAHAVWWACVKRQDVELLQSVALDHGSGRDDDIALVFLDRPVLKAPLANLPPPQASELGRELVAVGYGQRVRATGPAGWSRRFRGAKSAVRQTPEHVTPFEFAVPPAHQPCYGDVGAPAFDRAGGPVLAVVSRSLDRHPQTDCTVGAVYTRVRPYTDWIQSTLQDGCAQGIRTGCHLAGSAQTESCATTVSSGWVAIASLLILTRAVRPRSFTKLTCPW